MKNQVTSGRVLLKIFAFVSFFAPLVVTATPLTNGAAHDGVIQTSGDVDSFTFTANVNDSILINVGDLSGSAFSPRIRLEDPTNNQVKSDFGSGGAQVTHQAVLAGEYTVFIDDGSGGGTQTGAYRLHFIKAPGSLSISAGDEGGALTNGEYEDAVQEISDLDGWQFDADVGDTFLIGAGDTGVTAFSPRVRVYDPNGDLVASDFGTGGGVVSAQATIAGTYTLAVSDGSGGGTQTGTYRLHYLQAPDSFSTTAGDEGGAATNGAGHPGDIGPADIDGYTVTASVGESIVVHAGDTGPTSFSPYIRLYDPAGNLVKSSFRSGAANVEHSATQAGKYTIAISDGSSSNAESGQYEMHLARVPGTYLTPLNDEGGVLINGATQNGFIEVGDIDVWEFNAVVGANITLEMEDLDLNPGMSPRIRLYDPSGAQVKQSINSALASVSHTASVAGRYTVVLTDGSSGAALTGNYALRYTSDGEPSTTIVPFPAYGFVLFALLAAGLGARKLYTGRNPD